MNTLCAYERLSSALLPKTVTEESEVQEDMFVSVFFADLINECKHLYLLVSLGSDSEQIIHGISEH